MNKHDTLPEEDQDYYLSLAEAGHEYGYEEPIAVLSQSVRKAKNVLEDMKDRNYRPEKIRETRDKLISAVEDEYQKAVDTKLADANSVLEDEKVSWENKNNWQADKKLLEFRRLEASYNAMTEEDVYDKYKAYVEDEHEMPVEELNLILARLKDGKKRGEYKLMREYIEKRNDFRPWTKTERGKEAWREIELYKNMKPGFFRYRIGEKPTQRQELKVRQLL
jgi:hypothetical protein